MNICAKPLLKWAGGKTQMLEELCAHVPASYGTYIEPFFGGGALFFALAPERAVISDSNPELVNLYRQVASNVDEVVRLLRKFDVSEETYYRERALDWLSLDAARAAARTIFLNKTCFNGLYRVNRKGQFNVPYGRRSNPVICDEPTLRNASKVLQNAVIEQGDFQEVLARHAKPGDFVFLDPPYLPVSKNADFKRYTPAQFCEDDHIRLAREVDRLHDMGCSVVLTNSTNPLVFDLYRAYETEVIPTKRSISCNGSRREGEDVLVVA